jgi:uncharacterized protein (DUF433 family)
MATKQINYHDHISIHPHILGGKPVIVGTRIPVELIVERLANDLDLKSLLADYPQLTQEDVQACLLFYQAMFPKEGKPQSIQTKRTRGDQKKISVEDALALAGAWADLPSDHLEEDLNQIRHTSKPTPALQLDI